MKSQKRIVLAYSGGLDTSVILRWLQDKYSCEVITFTADLGQGEELRIAKKKAEMMGVKQICASCGICAFYRKFVHSSDPGRLYAKSYWLRECKFSLLEDPISSYLSLLCTVVMK